MGDNVNRKKNSTADPHYYSGRLKQKLNLLASSRAAVVEAPAGCGKTTAVRDYLEKKLPQSADIYWFSAVDEAPAALYRRFCREIEKIDNLAGKQLLNTGFPNAFTIGDVCETLAHIQCGHETWLVIDNFHFFCPALPPSFFCALLEHGGKALHIVIITQILGRDFIAAVSGRGFPHVAASDLRLEPADIRHYFSQADVEITETEAQKVFDFTNGWIIAVYLQLRNYQETGAFSETAVLQLMERLIWDKLTGEQQAFCLLVSPFETATQRQMCGLLNCDVLPDYAIECLSNPFIRYDPGQRRYEPHSIFFELMTKKRAERGGAFERECLMGAGDLCRNEGRTTEALGFYARAKHYERILSLDLSQVVFNEIGEMTFFEIALDIALNCPADLRQKYPFSMLAVAWALKSSGEERAFGQMMDELDEQLPKNGPLRAEWFLISAYQYYPRLEKMIFMVKKAAPLFDGTCSRIILPEAPWAFGEYFQVSEFHQMAGEADKEADLLETFIAIYSPLTGGHGSGADALFRSELAFMRGDTATAEIFAYKAVFQAESRRQSIIQLGAALTLARIAKQNADVAGWQAAVASMEHAASIPAQKTFIVQSVLDIARSALLVELGFHERIAGWLKNGEFSGEKLLRPLQADAYYVHFMYVLFNGDFNRLIGELEALLPQLRKRSVSSEFVCLILSAIGHCGAGNRAQAGSILEQAAEKGIPDGLIHILVDFSPLLQGLAEELIKNNYPRYNASFTRFTAQFAAGWDKLHNAIATDGLPPSLSKREREVAILVGEGLHNSEIAKKLFVSESTVRTHLRAIFQKLDIDRRAKLAEKLK